MEKRKRDREIEKELEAEREREREERTGEGGQTCVETSCATQLSFPSNSPPPFRSSAPRQTTDSLKNSRSSTTEHGTQDDFFFAPFLQ